MSGDMCVCVCERERERERVQKVWGEGGRWHVRTSKGDWVVVMVALDRSLRDPSLFVPVFEDAYESEES